MRFNRPGLGSTILAIGMLLAPAWVSTASNVEAIAQERLDLSRNTGEYFLEGNPFSGVATSFHPNGQTATLIEYQEGKRHGTYKKWFADGTLSFEATFQRGRLEGKSKTWWSNGNLRTEASYQEGRIHGTLRQWYRTGAKFKKLNFVDGKESGHQQAWRENGKLFCNYEYKDGRIYGLKRATMCFGVNNETVISSR